MLFDKRKLGVLGRNRRFLLSVGGCILLCAALVACVPTQVQKDYEDAQREVRDLKHHIEMVEARGEDTADLVRQLEALKIERDTKKEAVEEAKAKSWDGIGGLLTGLAAPSTAIPIFGPIVSALLGIAGSIAHGRGMKKEA